MTTYQELPVPPNLSGSWCLMHWDGRCSSLPFWRGTEDVTSSLTESLLHVSTASENREAIQAALRSQHFSAGPCAWEEEAVLVSCHPAQAIAHSHSHHLHPTQASYTSHLDLDAVWAQTLLPSAAGKGTGKARANGSTKPLSTVSNAEQEGAELLKCTAKLARAIPRLVNLTYHTQFTAGSNVPT